MDNLRSRVDRAVGSKTQLLSQLEKEFGGTSLKEARKKLAGLEKQLATAEESFESLLTAYEEEWGESLKDSDE